jgi:hypothetical protein
MYIPSNIFDFGTDVNTIVFVSGILWNEINL